MMVLSKVVSLNKARKRRSLTLAVLRPASNLIVMVAWLQLLALTKSRSFGTLDPTRQLLISSKISLMQKIFSMTTSDFSVSVDPKWDATNTTCTI